MPNWITEDHLHNQGMVAVCLGYIDDLLMLAEQTLDYIEKN